MLEKKIKEQILKITDRKQLNKFIKENNISLLEDDKEFQKHLQKYYSFPDDGIIRDLRKKITY